MIFVLLAILVSTGAGVWAELRWHERAVSGVQRALTVLLWTVLPVTAFLVIARLEITAGAAVGLLLGYGELAIVGVLAFVVGDRLLHLPRASTGAMIVCSMLANTGYLGLPLVLVLLGGDELGHGILWDTMISWPMAFIAAFAIGAAFGDRGGENVGERVRAFFTRNPVFWAILLALVAPDWMAPDDLFHAAKVLATSLLPVGFFMVGVYLSAEGEHGQKILPPPFDAAIGTVLALRMLAAPALLIGLAAVTVDVPDAYYLQAAMPCGINALIAAHVYGLDTRIMTAAIAWSTGIFVAIAVVLGLAT